MPRRYAGQGPPGDTISIWAETARKSRKSIKVPTFIDILSSERFGTYRGWATGDEALAVRLYTYNVQLSTALYGPLHMLEVALRNVVDRKLSAAIGPNWYDIPTALSLDAGTCQYQQGCMVSARETLRRARKPGTHCEIIAQLDFGFWSSLFGKGTHVLWGTLRPAFQARGATPRNRTPTARLAYLAQSNRSL